MARVGGRGAPRRRLPAAVPERHHRHVFQGHVRDGRRDAGPLDVPGRGRRAGLPPQQCGVVPPERGRLLDRFREGLDRLDLEPPCRLRPQRRDKERVRQEGLAGRPPRVARGGGRGAPRRRLPAAVPERRASRSWLSNWLQSLADLSAGNYTVAF